MKKTKSNRYINFPLIDVLDFVWIFRGKKEGDETEIDYNSLLKDIYSATTTLAIS